MRMLFRLTRSASHKKGIFPTGELAVLRYFKAARVDADFLQTAEIYQSSSARGTTIQRERVGHVIEAIRLDYQLREIVAVYRSPRPPDPTFQDKLSNPLCEFLREVKHVESRAVYTQPLREHARSITRTFCQFFSHNIAFKKFPLSMEQSAYHSPSPPPQCKTSFVTAERRRFPSNTWLIRRFDR